MTLFVCVKERMDSLDIYTVVSEMQELVEGWVGKIYQRNDEVIIRLRKEGSKNLFIKNGRWMFLTTRRKTGDKHPPTFAMTLRKYLNNKRISSISQNGIDRVVVITFSNSYSLIVEMFSDGNIILVDDEERIVLPMKFQSWSHREIRPGRGYLFPPERANPFYLDFPSFFGILKESDKDIIRTLVMDVNIPGKWSEEICEETHISKNMPSNEVGEKEVRELYDSMETILNSFREKRFEPIMVTDIPGEEDVDVIPFPIRGLDSYKTKRFESFNAALDEFFFRNFPDKREGLSVGKREKLLRQIKQQKEAIKKFASEAERRKEEGDAIYANYNLCEDILETVKKGTDTKITGEFVKRYSYPNVVLEIPYGGRKLEISLDVRKSAAQNANAKYGTDKKAKEKIEGAKKAMDKTIQKLEGLKIEVTGSEEKRPTKRFWFESYRWFISSGGNLVLGGKNASSNEKIVKKYLKAGDRYVHADIHGAPSCVVKAADAEGNELKISEKTLDEACQFALSYSKAWNQFASGSVYWVNPEQVSKTPESGEYLPKGAFVVRGKRNYVKCGVEMAIGKIGISGYEKIMGGPHPAVKKWADRWVVIEHGERDKNEAARYLAKKFDVIIEEIQRILPPGGITIKEERL